MQPLLELEELPVVDLNLANHWKLPAAPEIRTQFEQTTFNTSNANIVQAFSPFTPQNKYARLESIDYQISAWSSSPFLKG